MRSTLLCGLAVLLVAGCSWVTLEPGAEDVLVLPETRIGDDCTSLGKVKVSVADRVGALERHEEEVVEDLEILARNHAARRDGDTVVARGPVADGERQYEVFRCTPGEAGTSEQRPQQADEVETVPYDGGSDNN